MARLRPPQRGPCNVLAPSYDWRSTKLMKTRSGLVYLSWRRCNESAHNLRLAYCPSYAPAVLTPRHLCGHNPQRACRSQRDSGLYPQRLPLDPRSSDRGANRAIVGARDANAPPHARHPRRSGYAVSPLARATSGLSTTVTDSTPVSPLARATSSPKYAQPMCALTPPKRSPSSANRCGSR